MRTSTSAHEQHNVGMPRLSNDCDLIAERLELRGSRILYLEHFDGDRAMPAALVDYACGFVANEKNWVLGLLRMKKKNTKKKTINMMCMW